LLCIPNLVPDIELLGTRRNIGQLERSRLIVDHCKCIFGHDDLAPHPRMYVATGRKLTRRSESRFYVARCSAASDLRTGT